MGAVKLLDKDGLNAFTRHVRVKFETAAKSGNDDKEGFPGYARQRWGECSRLCSPHPSMLSRPSWSGQSGGGPGKANDEPNASTGKAHYLYSLRLCS